MTARPCPPHPPFNPAHPWWTWACPACRPELQRIITHRDADTGARRTQCPWCLNQASHRHGRYAKHADDTQQCRASLLSHNTAQLLLRAATEQHDQCWLIAQPPGPGRSAHHINLGSTSDTTAIIDQLVALRRSTGTTKADIAHNAGTNAKRLSCWESRTTTPEMHHLNDWAAALGAQIHLATPAGTPTRLTGAAQAAATLTAMRIGRGATQADVARNGRLSPENLSQWENGAKTPRLESLTAWARALGATIRLAPEAKP